MLGFIRLRQRDLDTGRYYQLESTHGFELRFRGHWICIECDVPSEEFLACCQCDRRQSQQSANDFGGGAARWPGYCDQDSLLRVSSNPLTGKYYSYVSAGMEVLQ